MARRIEYDEEQPYCEPDDVARWFAKFDEFTPETSPTAADVEEHILDWSEYIDRFTGHAWRENSVVEETRNLRGRYHWSSGIPVGLAKRDIREPDSEKGDKLEVWEGNNWNDWLTDDSKDYGRGEAYWIDGGTLYVRRRFLIRRRANLRVTYRYGNPNGPTRTVRQACAKLVAQDILSTDQYQMSVPGTDGAMDPNSMAQRWKEQAEESLEELDEVDYVEPW